MHGLTNLKNCAASWFYYRSYKGEKSKMLQPDLQFKNSELNKKKHIFFTFKLHVDVAAYKT